MQMRLTKLGANVTFLCPAEWAGEFNSVDSWDEVIKNSDVVMLLRVQHERHEAEITFAGESYHERYGLTEAREQLMKGECNHHASRTIQPRC